MADKHEDKGPPQDTEAETSSGSFIDDEFAGQHGTVASKSSLKDEKQVALHPQEPRGGDRKGSRGVRR